MVKLINHVTKPIKWFLENFYLQSLLLIKNLLLKRKINRITNRYYLPYKMKTMFAFGTVQTSTLQTIMNDFCRPRETNILYYVILLYKHSILHDDYLNSLNKTKIHLHNTQIVLYFHFFFRTGMEKQALMINM